MLGPGRAAAPDYLGAGIEPVLSVLSVAVRRVLAEEVVLVLRVVLVADVGVGADGTLEGCTEAGAVCLRRTPARCTWRGCSRPGGPSAPVRGRRGRRGTCRRA